MGAEENELIKEETKALIKQLEAEQGNLSQYTDQQEKAVKQKAEFEAQLITAGQLLIKMEEERVAATADKKVLEGENGVIKKDMEDIELAIQKESQQLLIKRFLRVRTVSSRKIWRISSLLFRNSSKKKTNRDHTIRHLNDEIANQDE